MKSTTITKLKIGECTAAQLRQYATEVCGLDNIPASSNRAAIHSRIIQTNPEAADPNYEIALVVTQRAEHARQEAVLNDEFVTILIMRTGETDGDKPVWVSVNGRGMFIERGKHSRIRRCYEEALRHAVQVVYDQDLSGGIPGPMVPREVQSYPYQIIPDVVPPATIKAA
jgi:hypothetical protein